MKVWNYHGGGFGNCLVGQAKTKPYWAETPIKPLY